MRNKKAIFSLTNLFSVLRELPHAKRGIERQQAISQTLQIASKLEYFYDCFNVLFYICLTPGVDIYLSARKIAASSTKVPFSTGERNQSLSFPLSLISSLF